LIDTSIAPVEFSVYESGGNGLEARCARPAVTAR
jgi:hypothetical protein